MNATCAECDRPRYCKGLCRLHYRRAWEARRIRTGECSIVGCRGALRSRGLCNSHYRRQQRYGDPLAGRPSGRRGEPDSVRFMRILHEGPPDECWPWPGSINPNGYGQFNIRDGGRRTTARAHRFTYELFVGDIPGGLELDHLCRNRACCNPAHLEPVTHSEHVRRGVERRERAFAIAAAVGAA